MKVRIQVVIDADEHVPEIIEEVATLEGLELENVSPGAK